MLSLARASQADFFQADPERRFPCDHSDIGRQGTHLLSQDILHIITWELEDNIKNTLYLILVNFVCEKSYFDKISTLKILLSTRKKIAPTHHLIQEVSRRSYQHFGSKFVPLYQ